MQVVTRGIARKSDRVYGIMLPRIVGENPEENYILAQEWLPRGSSGFRTAFAAEAAPTG